ncbi:hypothetical protein [Horticoccus sp. 23ND18S-11]|uniref:hypothetical protein n=1 Tax=Horticoccus sp. 23ND18S-11 TaxID=3391832 RepID=UPI0039C8CC93
MIATLRNHAGLPTGKEERSFTHALWLRKTSAAHLDLTTLSDDVLACLAELNAHWNTSNPEGIEGKSSVLEREFVAPVVTILGVGLGYIRERPADVDATRAIFRISTAWQAVLDGDIVDLKQHVEDTEAMSGL